MVIEFLLARDAEWIARYCERKQRRNLIRWIEKCLLILNKIKRKNELIQLRERALLILQVRVILRQRVTVKLAEFVPAQVEFLEVRNCA